MYDMMRELRLVKVLLSFIDHSGSNHSAFYLYASLSGPQQHPLICAWATIKGVRLMYGKVRILQ